MIHCPFTFILFCTPATACSRDLLQKSRTRHPSTAPMSHLAGYLAKTATTCRRHSSFCPTDASLSPWAACISSLTTTAPFCASCTCQQPREETSKFSYKRPPKQQEKVGWSRVQKEGRERKELLASDNKKREEEKELFWKRRVRFEKRESSELPWVGRPVGSVCVSFSSFFDLHFFWDDISMM